MKLVQLLAKELKEWPEGVTHLTQSEVDNEIYNALEGNSEGALDSLDHRFDTSSRHSERPYPIVSREQWRSEREKMNKPKWIRHRGGKCPVKAGTKVVTRYRDGVVSDWCMTRDQNTEEECLSAIWSHSGGETDIMAYYVEETKDQEIKKVKVTDAKLEMMQGDSWVTIGRVSSDFVASVFDGGPLPKDEEVKDTNLGTLTYKIEVDTSSAMTALNELSAKWDQLESPLKWRDEIIELEAYEEEFRREREKLIRKLESEGLKLIDHVASVCGETLADMDNWENWENGDVIEVINESKSSNAKPGLYMITGFESSHPKIELGGRYFPEYANMKFVRRP